MAAVRDVTDDPFARALEAGRSRYNALFALARMGQPRLHPEAFLEHLRTTVRLIVKAVHRHDPERVGPVLDVLYEQSLDLVGRGWMGPQARYPMLGLGWQTLFVAQAGLLAQDPQRVVVALTNALYNLSMVPSARPKTWIAGMGKAGKHVTGLEEWLEAGKVLAWRCGLVQYRSGVLETCTRLSPAVAAVTLGLDEIDAASLPSLLDALKENPWLRPEDFRAAPSEKKRLRLVKVCGGFRGTGGPFLTPPRVTLREGALVVWDRAFLWELHADAFGAVFQRLGKAPKHLKAATTDAFTMDETGAVRTAEQGDLFPGLAHWASAAATHTTLAVTLPDAHFVYLIGLTPDSANAA